MDSKEQRIVFNRNGLIESVNESKNWNVQGPTTRYIKYQNSVKSFEYNMENLSGDTLSSKNYVYQKGVLE